MQPTGRFQNATVRDRSGAEVGGAPNRTSKSNYAAVQFLCSVAPLLSELTGRCARPPSRRANPAIVTVFFSTPNHGRISRRATGQPASCQSGLLVQAPAKIYTNALPTACANSMCSGHTPEERREGDSSGRIRLHGRRGGRRQFVRKQRRLRRSAASGSCPP